MRFPADKASAKRAGAFAARLLPRRAPERRRVVCLCYHSVHPTYAYAERPDVFERHLAWLSETCDLIPFDAVREAAAEPHGARPAVTVTFDDGHADNHEIVFPLLRKYEVPATVFVTTGLVDREPEALARFRELLGTSDVRPLGWDEVRELAVGGVEIGAHTHTHPNLIRLDRADVARELRVSKALLEDRLGRPVDSLAYPFGKPGRHFDPSVVELARAEGYTAGAAVLSRGVRPADDPLAVPRFLGEGPLSDLEAKVRGDWDWLAAWQERAPRRLARLVSPRDFEV